MFEITVKRRVQTYPYESLEVGLTEQFDDDKDRDKAFQETARTVEEWVESELLIMGLKPREHPA